MKEQNSDGSQTKEPNEEAQNSHGSANEITKQNITRMKFVEATGENLKGQKGQKGAKGQKRKKKDKKIKR